MRANLYLTIFIVKNNIIAQSGPTLESFCCFCETSESGSPSSSDILQYLSLPIEAKAFISLFNVNMFTVLFGYKHMQILMYIYIDYKPQHLPVMCYFIYSLTIV